MLARPAHLGKDPRHARSTPQTDEPIAAVQGPAEHGMVAAKAAKRWGDPGGCHAGNVAANDRHRSRRQHLQDALHATAEIPMALWHANDAPRPAGTANRQIR